MEGGDFIPVRLDERMDLDILQSGDIFMEFVLA